MRSRKSATAYAPLLPHWPACRVMISLTHVSFSRRTKSSLSTCLGIVAREHCELHSLMCVWKWATRFGGVQVALPASHNFTLHHLDTSLLHHFETLLIQDTELSSAPPLQQALLERSHSVINKSETKPSAGTEGKTPCAFHKGLCLGPSTISNKPQSRPWPRWTP